MRPIGAEWKSTAFPVNSMNASSSEARTGVSSCTVMDVRAASSPMSAARMPRTVMAPSSLTFGRAPASESADEALRGRRDDADRVTLATGRELVNAGLGDQRAPADDDEPLGRERHFVDEMARDEHSASFRGEVAQQVADPTDALGIETVDGLVEQQDTGIPQQGAGDAQALAHPE